MISDRINGCIAALFKANLCGLTLLMVVVWLVKWFTSVDFYRFNKTAVTERRSVEDINF
jgi:hypothetical protein